MPKVQIAATEINEDISEKFSIFGRKLDTVYIAILEQYVGSMKCCMHSDTLRLFWLLSNIYFCRHFLTSDQFGATNAYWNSVPWWNMIDEMIWRQIKVPWKTLAFGRPILSSNPVKSFVFCVVSFIEWTAFEKQLFKKEGGRGKYPLS